MKKELPMKLCLSARAFAAPGGNYSVTVEDLIKLAKEIGYDGITLRRGQLDETTPEAEVDRIRELLRKYDAPCSFVAGASAGDEAGLKALCTIIDRAASVGAFVVQPTVRDHTEIPLMQRAADHAAAQNVVLAPQIHNHTAHENAEQAAELVDAVGRSNFGIAFEALISSSSSARSGTGPRSASWGSASSASASRTTAWPPVNRTPGTTTARPSSPACPTTRAG